MEYSSEQNQVQGPRYAIFPAPFITEAPNPGKAIENYNSLPKHEQFPGHRVKFVLPQCFDRVSNIQSKNRVKYTDRNDSTKKKGFP